MKYKEIWKPRTIRMSNKLWEEVKQKAKQLGIDASEYVRQLIKRKELK